MNLHPIDIAIFLAFILAVVAIGIVTSRHEKDSESYFLAGRGLSWWLSGFSLIVANISTEQFVGMSGNAADRLGLAIANYEWLAAITLVVVAFFFLPYFLRAGLDTIPEFLEQRFNRATRSLMALCMVLIYVFLVAAVTYSGALTLQTAFAGRLLFGFLPLNLMTGSWLITGMKPLPKPVELGSHARIELASSRSAKVGGVLVVLLTLALYAWFF